VNVGSGRVTVRPAVGAERAAVRELVADAGLPLEGLDGVWRTWVAADDAGHVVGTASLERHGDALLLRSVAVHPRCRGDGVGAQLVTAALAAATPVGPVALLTETAADWFPRFGFHPVPRGRLHPALHASPELAGVCPSTAVAMTRPVPAAPPRR